MSMVTCWVEFLYGLAIVLKHTSRVSMWTTETFGNSVRSGDHSHHITISHWPRTTPLSALSSSSRIMKTFGRRLWRSTGYGNSPWTNCLGSQHNVLTFSSIIAPRRTNSAGRGHGSNPGMTARPPGIRPATDRIYRIKLTQAGFTECVDTEDMAFKYFRRMERDRILPSRDTMEHRKNGT